MHYTDNNATETTKIDRNSTNKRLRNFTVLAVITIIVLVIVVIVLALKDNDDNNETLRVARNDNGASFPCPPHIGGLMTSGEPLVPGPFHDVTTEELKRVRAFLMTVEELNLTDSRKISISSSYLYMVDLLLPPKKQVLEYLSGARPQPEREAYAMIFRGDLRPPVVQEYRVGPLSKPHYARLLNSTTKRNPVQFSLRPYGPLELTAIEETILPLIDSQIGSILKESFGGTFTDCGDMCLTYNYGNVGTALIEDFVRKNWVWATANVEYSGVMALDIGFLVNVDSTDPASWSVEKVWYAGALYNSLAEFKSRYYDDQNPINKTRQAFVFNTPDLPTSMNLRGDPVPETPQRPPTQIEPDGKRYKINYQHVTYMGWSFNFRMSAFHGTQLYDIRFRGERIAYELGLSDLAVFYSGDNPMQRYMDFIDGGELIGVQSRSLIPGADCPDRATMVSTNFIWEDKTAPINFAHAFCVFEQNTGIPLRRHMSFSYGSGNFYGGLLDSVLVLRSIFTIVNYDYVVDFQFHQSGAVEVRLISTGYILGSYFRPAYSPPYGFQVTKDVLANLHEHLFHLKVDLDVLGTSNRYETLDLSTEHVDKMPMGDNRSSGVNYSQVKMTRRLRVSELDALYNFNFDHPKYHLVYNQAHPSDLNNQRAYRLHLSGITKQLLPVDVGNEPTIAWARHQMAVTVRKEDEAFSSSPYAMFDSLDPVVKFDSFYNDNETIVDQDLVFWVSLGTQHIPHTEDLPVTDTVGGHLSLFLLPYNYFPESPAVSSRDAIRVEGAGGRGVGKIRVTRYGTAANAQCGAESVEDMIKKHPEDVLQVDEESTSF